MRTTATTYHEIRVTNTTVAHCIVRHIHTRMHLFLTVRQSVSIALGTRSGSQGEEVWKIVLYTAHSEGVCFFLVEQES